MSQRVPFEVIQTGDVTLDRIQRNVDQAVRQLQEQVAPAQSISTTSNVVLAKQTTVTVTSFATKSVVVALPNQVPTNQTTRIVNQSAYPVKVRTSDAKTVLDDVAPGASMVIVADGVAWSKA